jgi:hypothetical protein
VNAVLAEVALNAVLDWVDVTGLVERINVHALAGQIDLGAVIVRSSSEVACDALDVVRSQTVGLDEFIARWIGRLRRRSYAGPPGGAAGLGGVLTERAGDAPSSGAPVVIQTTLLGKCAGFASLLPLSPWTWASVSACACWPWRPSASRPGC